MSYEWRSLTMRFFLLLPVFSIVAAVSIAAPVLPNNGTNTDSASSVARPPVKEAKAKVSVPDRAQPIDLPAPVGEDMKGIIIPQYDTDGRLSMKFFADTARKLDDHKVEIHQLKIDFFEKDGKDITVLMPHGLFNLETKILFADTEITIKREDFEIVGQSAEFDTIKRSGTMKGHVHTDIRNTSPSGEL